MLKKLTETNGVSGCETQIRDIIENEIRNFCDDIKIDSLGNLIAYKKASEQAMTVLLSAHMDEVGFIVSDITNDGYLKFESVGSIDPRTLISQRVCVNGLSGVISLKAIHLTSKDEREKDISEDMLYIDVGASCKEELSQHVTKGDYISFDSKYIEFGDLIKSKALDDRLGCAILIDILKSEVPVNLYCAFTVQEEIGLRGAKAAIYGLNPDYAIVVEGTTCNDLPGVPENLTVTKIGNGAALSLLDSASKSNNELLNMLVESAKKRNIPYQFKAATTGGNDAGAIHIANGGIKTCTISVPCRYIHSPVSVMSKKDFLSCQNIVKAFLEDCGSIYGGNSNA